MITHQFSRRTVQEVDCSPGIEVRYSHGDSDADRDGERDGHSVARKYSARGTVFPSTEVLEKA